MNDVIPQSDVTAALATVVEAIGGATRAGQIDMAQAVTDAMNGSSHLLVEAGTGTGKSLGYLIPAIVRASNGVVDGKNRTIVATATLALQRQLAEHDLPRALAALNPTFDREVTFAVLKGRANYVCLDKFNRDASTAEDDGDQFLFDAPTSVLGKQAKKLRAWVKSTESGDRDEFSDDLDGRLWRSVSVNGRECVGAAKCAFGDQCFAEAAKQRAFDSDIVVTNHALLAIDIVDGVPLLPDHDAVIIDEAHELVDRTTNALAGSLDVRTIERGTGQVRKFIEPATHSRLMDVTDDLAAVLNAIATTGDITRFEELPTALHATVTSIRDVARVALNELTSSSQDDANTVAAKSRARAGVSEIADVAADLLAVGQDSVRWLDTQREPTLHHAPLSVAHFLADSLFADRAVVLTSATLEVAGSLEATARSVGIAQSGNWRGLNVGSPFDYQRQGILYCASRLDRPDASGISLESLDELGDLLDAAGGRTLALFSSWRAVERAYEYLSARFRGREDRPLLCAMRGEPIGELVKRFRDDPQTSLLGTVSLWQGIDVPGDSCTLVTIDRIPFPRPDDPVMKARSDEVDAHGGSGFRSVSLPRAALLLAQGVGRLIRSDDDRGVVAVLDSRLATANYGAKLRESLPPLWWSTDKESVLGALRRLDEQAGTPQVD